jgi:hypothetical protein
MGSNLERRAYPVCGPATLHRRDVWIVGLNTSELARANEWAETVVAEARRRRRRHQDDGHQGDTTSGARPLAVDVDRSRLGAQGEIAAGKALGLPAPLDLNAFGRPNIPPDWDVRTQRATGVVMRGGHLEIVAKIWNPAWRYVLVERDETIRGEYLFIVHGWINGADARKHAVKLYASPNLFVHIRWLQPLP